MVCETDATSSIIEFEIRVDIEATARLESRAFFAPRGGHAHAPSRLLDCGRTVWLAGPRTTESRSPTTRRERGSNRPQAGITQLRKRPVTLCRLGKPQELRG